jgi:hypothetical protein
VKPLTLERLGWRLKPGILGKHASSPQSVHALLGYFLKDRASPTPFPGRDMLATSNLFEWGIAPPLERVIESPAHLQLLLGMPELYRQSVAVIEPWEHVGNNLRGEAVRASKNIAYILQQVGWHIVPGVAQRHRPSRAAGRCLECRHRHHRPGRQSFGSRRRQL